MGVKYENDCCGCAVPGYPCTGEHKKVPHLYCDDCKKEQDELYELDGKELCGDCVLKRLDKVKV